jgi:hypothetical protein
MAKAKTSASGIITLFVLALLGAVAWFVAPMFLPVYRWQHVDFARIAADASRRGIPTTIAQVSTEFDVEFAYQPRGTGDPRPWVLLAMTPSWADATGDDANDESGKAVRCTVIGERTGKTVSDFLLGSNHYKDRFFQAKAWRLPPGSLPGMDAQRPIILFKGGTLEKMEYGKAETLQFALRDPRLWEPDDDEWTPPAAAE